MIKKIVTIILPVLIITGLFIYFAIDFQKNNYGSFIDDGYVLTASKENSAERYYFNAETSYKKKYPEKIIFNDVDGNAVSLSNASFVHFVDGSVSTLKKGVILNLDDINSEIISYYNFFEQSVLKYNNGNYYVDNLNKQMEFTKFILKINDNKYLIVGNEIKLKIDDNEEKNLSGYAELTFFDGNITRIENQQVSYQTVSSSSYIKIGDNVLINTSNQGIYFGEEKKLTLSQMVIDSDDNIPIVPPEEEKDDADNENDDTNDNNENNSNENNNNNIGGINGGNDNNEVAANDKIKTPIFTITNMDVSSNTIDANVKISDDDNLLDGTVRIKIYENSSWKKVYSVEDNTGTFDLSVFVENLRPETSYTLVMEADYTINNIDYNKEFISKSFRTESLGISIDKYYYSRNNLAFNVSVDNYSEIATADIKMYSSEGVLIETKSVDAVKIREINNGTLSIVFNELEPNTSYMVTMGNYLYNNAIISSAYNITINAKTLKNKPTFGELNYNLDKRNSSFTLWASNVSDVDKGITSYRYEIYDVRTLSEDDIEPALVIEKNTLTNVEVIVDDISLFRGVPYVFKLITLFNDNEKVYEYESGYSDVFKLEGVTFPTISFSKDLLTFERIKGIISINDISNTIPLNNDNFMTIVYTNNSVGITQSFTTAGNLTIPIDINNLRANESYTISLYATVDLQDGKNAIDSCFIGSISFNTKKTNSFVATFEDNTTNDKDSFSMNAKLQTSNGIDNTLEAQTLTGITFSLYDGKNTLTTPIRTVKKIDRDLREYYSELKVNYYDQSFKINPAFFDLSNSDITGDYYTIKISQAYDYTTYKNEIPVTNDTFTVKTKGTAPPAPIDPTVSFEINDIKNKDTGTDYNKQIDAETVVGYKIRANYDNSRKYAKYFMYKVYNALTDKPIEEKTIRYNVPDNGVIDYVYFYLDDSTTYSVADNNFSRGNNYYFTYEAYLDLDGDNIPEVKYPYDDIDGNTSIIRSVEITPLKNQPKILMYPSVSDANTFTWKYKINDYDKALYTDKFYYTLDAGEKKETESIVTENNDYKPIVFSEMNSGYFNVKIKQALLKNEKNIEERNLIYQYYDGEYTIPILTYHTFLDSNRLIITINDYENNKAIVNRITSYNLIFTSSGDSIVLNNYVADNGTVIVDLSKIATFINKNITLQVVALFDNGHTGFELSGDYHALQTIKNSNGGGDYLTINRFNNFYGSESAAQSVFNTTFNSSSLYLKNIISEYEKTIDTEITENGIMYNGENYLLKGLSSKVINGDGSENFSFNVIVPSVSLNSAGGSSNIAPGLRDVSLLISMYGVVNSKIKDNLIYIDIYETDESGLVSNPIPDHPRISVNIDNLSEIISISDLIPTNYYYFKLTADIYDGTKYVNEQLYDVDAQSNTKLYFFKTLDSISITKLSTSFIATSYEQKYINISYNVGETVGYDRIEYSLYKYVYENENLKKELVNTDIANDILFTPFMTKNISIAPGSGFEFGATYELIVKPISTVSIGGQLEDIKLQEASKTFRFNTLLTPYVGASGSPNSSGGFDIKVSVNDLNKVIVDGTYTIKILDSGLNDITPVMYQGISFSIKNLNKIFTLDSYNNSATYYIVVNLVLDKSNDMTTTEIYSSKHELKTPGLAGINTGDIYASKSSTDSGKIDLFFYNTYHLTEVKELRYSIYNSSGYAVDNVITFQPTQLTNANGSYYGVTLNEKISEAGLYYMELQFIVNNVVIATDYVQFSY